MPKTNIIIPCYNEANRLDLHAYREFLQNGENYSIYFVNDGSTDETKETLKSLNNEFPLKVTVLNHDRRRGKGEAVRTGLAESYKDTLAEFHGYLDADLSVSFDEFMRLEKLLQNSTDAFILGSRIKKVGSRISRNEWRHFYGRIVATVASHITGMEVYDTQCSAKIFRRDLLPGITGEAFRTRWLFDIELIDRLRKHLGPLEKYGKEEPLLSWSEKKGSKIRWYSFPRIAREIFILHKHNRQR